MCGFEKDADREKKGQIPKEAFVAIFWQSLWL
jgi:hypothetical protein